MTTFLALYRGNKIGDAQLIAVSVDAELVASVARHILDQTVHTQQDDPILDVLHQRRLDALRIVAQQSGSPPPAKELNKEDASRL